MSCVKLSEERWYIVAMWTERLSGRIIGLVFAAFGALSCYHRVVAWRARAPADTGDWLLSAAIIAAMCGIPLFGLHMLVRRRAVVIDVKQKRIDVVRGWVIFRSRKRYAFSEFSAICVRRSIRRRTNFFVTCENPKEAAGLLLNAFLPERQAHELATELSALTGIPFDPNAAPPEVCSYSFL